MMYMMTEQEHAQIVDAIYGCCYDYPLNQAYEMLKAMRPVSPIAHLIQHDETGRTRYLEPTDVFTDDGRWSRIGPLYTPTKD